MFEVLFIITLIGVGASYDVESECITIHRDFVEIQGLQVGWNYFPYKNYDVTMAYAVVDTIPESERMFLGYTTPIPNCVPTYGT